MWAWVKSWDIGFAAVHVFRDIMWKIMSHRLNAHQETLDWDDPASVISVIYNNDPFFTENTYWMIISTLTLAIPFITAHFFLGATGMFDLFSGTIDQTADRFGEGTERKRSRRFIANVNEHFQRVAAMRVALAYGNAGLRQENARNMDGDQIFDAPWGGISSARAGYAAGHFHVGRMLAQLGTQKFNTSLSLAQADAEGNNRMHLMRGMVPMEQSLAPQIGLKDGKPQYDMRAVNDLFGEGSRAAQQWAESGKTWGDLFNHSAEFQLNNQARTAAETGRRMMNPIRFSRSIGTAIAIREQQAQFMRGPVANVKAANTPLINLFAPDTLNGERVLRDLGDLNRPAMEHDDIINPAFKKD